MKAISSFAVALTCLGAACGSNGGAGDSGTDAGPPPAPELGTGDHTPTSVTFTVIASSADKLAQPRDLAFNTRSPDELWIVNHDTESTTIVHDASTDGRASEWRKDTAPSAPGHFMAYPSAIAFGGDVTSAAPLTTGVAGKPGTFATVGESENTYDGMQAATEFMGPALWSSDLSVYAKYDPNGLGSHLDMLHCSPLAMGIDHDTAVDSAGRANTFWVFTGKSRTTTSTSTPVAGTASIVKYNFNADNGVGNDDHSDGEAYQYATGLVSYVKNVPSHVFFNADDAMLYIADTGNQRVAKLDTTVGTLGVSLTMPETMKTYRMMNDAVVTDVVPADTGPLVAPSGIEIHNGLIYVTDNQSGIIYAFTLDGTQVNYLDTGLPSGSLAGLTFSSVDGKIYFVDMVGNQVLRIDP